MWRVGGLGIGLVQLRAVIRNLALPEVETGFSWTTRLQINQRVERRRDRTMTSSLGSWRSTSELLPLNFVRLSFRSIQDNARQC